MTGTTNTRLPSGVHVLMCYYNNPCKVAKSDEEKTYNQRYWMCANYAFGPNPHQIRIGLMVRILFFCHMKACVCYE
jgi:hypothetical protein